MRVEAYVDPHKGLRISIEKETLKYICKFVHSGFGYVDLLNWGDGYWMMATDNAKLLAVKLFDDVYEPLEIPLRRLLWEVGFLPGENCITINYDDDLSYMVTGKCDARAVLIPWDDAINKHVDIETGVVTAGSRRIPDYHNVIPASVSLSFESPEFRAEDLKQFVDGIGRKSIALGTATSPSGLRLVVVSDTANANLEESNFFALFLQVQPSLLDDSSSADSPANQPPPSKDTTKKKKRRPRLPKPIAVLIDAVLEESKGEELVKLALAQRLEALDVFTSHTVSTRLSIPLARAQSIVKLLERAGTIERVVPNSSEFRLVEALADYAKDDNHLGDLTEALGMARIQRCHI